MTLNKDRAEAVWEGSVTEGSGRVAVASGAFPEQAITLKRRTEGGQGTTSPEELIAAAHASCYSMALSAALTRNDTPPERIDVTAEISLDRVEGGLKITGVELTARARVPQLDEAAFQELAQRAEQSCPVSNALRGNVDIRLQAELV
ncbi:MAG: OsmC family peroxiredoxin [Dehalococcoidia bacterium]